MTNLNKILIFGAGFLTGALLFGGYIKEKYEAEAQEEIDAMKEYMDETIAKMGEDLQRDLEHFQDKIEQEAPERKDRVDYVQVASRYDTGGLDIDGDDIVPIQADEEASKVFQEETGEAPYIIDRDTFDHTNPHYSKVTITYYAGDDILADDEENVVPDVELVVGHDALTSFGQDSDDPEVVLVRNELLGSDYEIIRTFESYSETVLGIGGE